MKLYEQVCQNDIVGPVTNAIASGIFEVKFDNTIQAEKRIKGEQTIWINNKADPDRNCALWHGIYFTYYQFIPRVCRHCWKIVWVGDTLKQLMTVLDIQEKTNSIAKCGMETRAHSGCFGRPRGFWYVPLDQGLKGARELHKIVHELLLDVSELKNTNVVLKRGCTEFEGRYPSSDTWDQLAKQFDWDRDEARCDKIIRLKWESRAEPNIIKIQILKGWIEFAASLGLDYAEYSDKILTIQTLNYERSNHNEKDYLGLKVGENRREPLGKAEGKSVDGGGDTIGRTSGKIDTEF